jgi:hypothetical protein
MYRECGSCVCPVCVPAPPVSFYRESVCCWWVWMVVRFVYVWSECLLLWSCASARGVSRVSRVCPGSPRCLFTESPRVPCVSRLPPVSFYRDPVLPVPVHK